MLCLDKVLMGVIEIEPKEILIDGLRKELGRTLANILHEGFIFTKKTNTSSHDDLESKFRTLRDKITGLKRSIEYIQDFLNVYGEKIWNEELTRIIEFAVEKEATALVNKKYSTSLIEA
jgi:WASH complex subunit strumpellin